jgi:hypothetical protein
MNFLDDRRLCEIYVTADLVNASKESLEAKFIEAGLGEVIGFYTTDGARKSFYCLFAEKDFEKLKNKLSIETINHFSQRHAGIRSALYALETKNLLIKLFSKVKK